MWDKQPKIMLEITLGKQFAIAKHFNGSLCAIVLRRARYSETAVYRIEDTRGNELRSMQHLEWNEDLHALRINGS